MNSVVKNGAIEMASDLPKCNEGNLLSLLIAWLAEMMERDAHSSFFRGESLIGV
uniref:Uncharacterized protein n=1 Tax=Nelumbo nucifera TaxID=4432 RepID=A0A822XIW1_NELNU|nr:TPA_asm: hypothetical protein HUJ06_021650 [Nelumbo nucifera]